jgi:hypothetical protein
MKLTDNEIRDINKHLEAGKPLPDKYRFLLFEEKREVELVWNGKTREVCNIVLPFQTIEQVDEPRAEKSEDTVAQQDLFSTDSRGRAPSLHQARCYWDLAEVTAKIFIKPLGDCLKATCNSGAAIRDGRGPGKVRHP